jgi:tetratricopeptide (TPR) repeat protein
LSKPDYVESVRRHLADQPGPYAHQSKPIDLLAVAAAPAWSKLAIAQARSGDIKSALISAARIAFSDKDRAAAYEEIARAYARALDLEAVERTVTKYIPERRAAERVYQAVAIELARARHVQGALRFAKKVADPESALAAIAIAQVADGDLSGAALSVKRAPNLYTLERIVEYLSNSGRYDEALRFAAYAGKDHVILLPPIVHARVSAGDSNGARNMVKSIATSEEYTYLYWVIAVAHANLGDREATNAAVTAATSLDGVNEFFIAEIIASRARQGDVDGALREANQLTDAWARSDAHKAICDVLLRAKLFDSALKVARQSEGEYRRQILEMIAIEQAKQGDVAGAQRTIAEGVLGDDAQTALAEAMIVARDFDGARKAIEAVSKGYRAADLAKLLAVELSMAGDIKAGFDAALSIESMETAVEAVREIAKALVLTGRRDYLISLINEFAKADRLPHFLAAVVEAQAQVGDIDGAARTAKLIEGQALAQLWAAYIEKSLSLREHLDLASYIRGLASERDLSIVVDYYRYLIVNMHSAMQRVVTGRALIDE